MTGARGRVIRADLLTDKLRSMLVIVFLAVGVAAVGGTFSAATTVEASFASGLRAANQPSAVLTTGPFPAGLVEQVGAHPLVGHVDGRRLHRALVVNVSGERSSVQMVAMTDFAQNRVGRIAAAEGQWPPQPDSIVVERASLDALSVSVGDPLQVDVPGRAPVELIVVGTAFDASEVAPMLGGSLRAYVAMETMVELTGSDHLDSLYLRSTGASVSRNDAVEMTAAVRNDVLSPAGVPVGATLIGDPGRHPAQKALSFLTLVVQVLSLLTLAVAVALVVSTVAAGLAQQRRQLGVMKTIGATGRQLTTQSLAHVVVLSGVAAVVSIPFAIAAARAFSGYLAGLANVELEPIGVPVAAIALHLGVGVLLPALAVVGVVRRAGRTTVLDAITNRGLAGSGRTRAGNWQIDRPTILAYRNAVASPLRLGLAAVTVSLSGAVGVGVLNTGSALGEVADQVAGHAFDIVVAPLLLVLVGVLSILAVVAVAGTMTLGVVEQTPEIGVLRTLGATNWALRRLLLTQGLAVAAPGALLGVLLAVPVTLLLGAAVGGSLISAAVPFAFSEVGVAIWAAAALAIGALGAIPPARVAARLPVREALAYE